MKGALHVGYGGWTIRSPRFRALVVSLLVVASTAFAAQAQASEGLEQVRAAKWDPTVSTGAVDQVVSTNFPVVVQLLDVPGSSARPIYATNVTTISTVSTNPLLKMIRVDCIWTYLNGQLYTNSMFTYRAPDQ